MSKAALKLPGESKSKKPKATGKLVIKPGEVLTRLTSKELRQLLGKGYPCYLDFSAPHFQLENDEFLFNCTNIVKEIDFTGNALTEIVSMEHLSKLKRLTADKNNITNISFKNLINLEYLSLAQNRLAYLSDMNDLKKLVNLNLTGNRITSGLAELAKLKNLQVLDLSRNSIDFSIEQFYSFLLIHIKGLPKLKYLSFAENPIEVKIPSFKLFIISELPKLGYLNWVPITKEEKNDAERFAAQGKWNDKNNPPTAMNRMSSVKATPELLRTQSKKEVVEVVDASQIDSILSSLNEPPAPIVEADSSDDQHTPKSPAQHMDLNYLDLLNEMISSSDSELTKPTATTTTDTISFDSLTESLQSEFADVSETPTTTPKSDAAKVDYLDMLYELITDEKSASPSPSPSGPSELTKSLSFNSATSEDSSLFDLIGEIMEQPQENSAVDFDALTASIAAELEQEANAKRLSAENQEKASEAAKLKQEEEEKRKAEDEHRKAEETKRKAEDLKRVEEERLKQEEEQWQKRRLELEEWKRQEEEKWRREAEQRRKEEEERRRKEEEEWKRQREEEEKRRREELERWKAEEEKRRLEELEKWKREEAEKRKREEEELKRAEEMKKAAEAERLAAEQLRKAIEEERRIVQEEEERLRQLRLEEERKIKEELAKFEEERKKREAEEERRQQELRAQAEKLLQEKQRQLEEDLRRENERRAQEEAAKRLREEEERKRQEEEWAQKRLEYENRVKKLDEEKNQAKSLELEVPSSVNTLLETMIASPPKGDMADIKFTELTLGEKLGVGTFGATWKGSWKGVEVAIKQLAIRNVAAITDKVHQETPAMKALNHPNLVEFYGLSIDKSICSVWEFVTGVTLHAFMQRSKVVNFPFVVKAALGIASAMSFLHYKNIAHRALKSKNVLLDKKANIKVTDYGLESVKDELLKSSILTSPEYCAPELLLQRKHDKQVDVYSFGILLWEMCTLQQPYSGLNPKQVIVAVIKNGLRPPIPANCPIALSKLMQACWNTDASKRPAFANIVKLLSQPADKILLTADGKVATSFTPTQAKIVPPASNVAKASVKVAPTAQTPVPSSATKPVAPSVAKIASPAKAVPTQTTQTPATTPAPATQATPKGPAAQTKPTTPSAPTAATAKQPHSVVIKVLDYLKQPSEETQLKAMKAMANLVKTEENREALIETENGISSVVQKLHSTNVAIQEETARALAILAEDGECTDLIREADGVAPLISLLSSPSNAVALESLKALTRLAENDTNKAVIRTLNGLPPIMKLLQHPDENFKMQASWAVSILLEDEENQKEFTNIGGVNVLLGLVNAPNPALQLRVLVSLGALMITETSNAIKQAGILQRFIKLLSSKSANLQKHGVTGIQRFSALPDLRIAIFKLGGLKSLVELVASPDQGVSVLALKSLVNFATEDSYCERLRIFQIVPMLANQLKSTNQEIVLESTKLLLPLIKEANAKHQIASSSIPVLLKLISSRNEQISTASLLVLASVSDLPESLKTIGDSNGIPAVLNLLESYDDVVKLAAAKITGDLTQQKENKEKIKVANGIPRIVNLFASANPEIKEKAALCIANLSDDPSIRKIVREERGLYPLVELLNYPIQSLKERVAWSVANFLTDAESHSTVAQAGGFENIVKSLGTPSESLTSYSLKSILILAQNPVNRPHLINAGVKSFLQPLTSSTNRTIQLASTKALSMLQ